MDTMYDLAIVGAGPAGLMAAKQGAELGLKVIVIEKNKDFTTLRRACSAQFIMDTGYEGETIKIKNNKIIFTENKFEVNYSGSLVNIKNKYYYSPKGHRIHFANQNKKPFAIKFDKRKLLKDLYIECIELGVDIRMLSLVSKGKDYGEYVDLNVVHKKKQYSIKAKKLIIAEGVNANLTGLFGFNKGRKHFATAYVLKYMLEGVTDIEPNSWNLFYGMAYHSKAAVIIGPSLQGDNIVELTVSGDINLMPENIFENVVNYSPLKNKFTNAKILDKQGCCVKAWSSLKTPYKGNVIVIGDSAAFVEVETQGALMCGFQAANAIKKELQGENGFIEYTNWWNKSFEFNSDEYLKVSQGYALVPTYTDDELDYLFYLVEGKTLEGTYSQYKTPKLIWDAILSNKNKINKERPSLSLKISKMNDLTLSSTFGTTSQERSMLDPSDIIDLIVVGAGPAGLTAAKTAAELGLNVTVIEIKNNLTEIKRACSAQFVLDQNYENETLNIKNNKIIFTQNRFYINYDGPLMNIVDNYFHSPSGNQIHLAHHKHRPFAVKFDKEHLISNLFEECINLGVNFITGTKVTDGTDFGDYVAIKTNNSTIPTIKGKKLIIAEGANAKLTGKFKLNKDRKFFGMPLVVMYTLSGTNGFAPHSWNQFYGNTLHPFAEILVESSLCGKDCVEVTIVGNKNIMPDTIFENLITNSPMKKYFCNSKLIDKTCCAVKSYAPINKPYLGNVISIGDSAAHMEVICQGAIMCGYHAANAVKDELEGNNGFEKYTLWWSNTFDFNKMDSLEFIQLYKTLSIKTNFTDVEIDYLFSLLKGKRLCGNFSQYEVPKNIWTSILNYKTQIEIENPALYEKIKPISQLLNNK